MSEQIVEFYNKDKQKLLGVAHIPTKSARNTVVILLNAGIEDSIGPHRLNVDIARRLCNENITVFRFDTNGIGLSAGELKSGSNIDNFFLIQNGLFVDDTRSAVEYVHQKFNPRRIILLGVCGGAVTALLNARIDEKIDSLVLIDPPVYLDLPKDANKVNSLEAKIFVESKKNKVVRISSWKKLLSGKMDINKIIKFAVEYMKISLVKLFSGRGAMENVTIGRPLNKKFVDAFSEYIATKRKIFFVLGENNIIGNEFESKFKERYLTSKISSLFRVINVESANHEFHSLDSQRILLDEVSAWCNGVDEL